MMLAHMTYYGDIDDFIHPDYDADQQWRDYWDTFKIDNHDSPFESLHNAIELEDQHNNDEERDLAKE